MHASKETNAKIHPEVPPMQPRMAAPGSNEDAQAMPEVPQPVLGSQAHKESVMLQWRSDGEGDARCMPYWVTRTSENMYRLRLCRWDRARKSRHLNMGMFESSEDAKRAANGDAIARRFLRTRDESWITLTPKQRLAQLLEVTGLSKNAGRQYGPGFLYILEIDGFLKFGYTIDPYVRLKQYRTGEYTSILTPWGTWASLKDKCERFNFWGVIAVPNRLTETAILQRFREERLKFGNSNESEWFALDSRFAKFARRLKWMALPPRIDRRKKP